ncbi:MAG: transposase [Brasilonema octagenarum HA4186-MV1]|uniref:Transposase IS204/IS1001/IS1096/IS1165 DDE domain-containing protein n=2 Tax=Brasilonema TaxID=383614 RepID=A0A856ML01_9CYAN|nr:transposase [Brasilonema octagenarum HA4186-MV1]NMF63516.1 hypothetical protein [Brasilonema octagenarum UFV-OR1]QDL12063.1 hypothetical protein DP114_02030 [Brasilonema sennae CENA114]QDL18439.1 hypothetical protein DP113_01990 [Brasilonema octagenarum UFV-E1]
MVRWCEIFAYFGKITTNAVVKSLKNKLKLVKWSVYGFRNY